MGNDPSLTVVENGAGNADANSQCLTTSANAGNEVYASGGSLLSAVNNSLIIEVDAEFFSTGDNGGAVVQNGNSYGNTKGWHIALAIVSGGAAYQFICRNTANNGAVSTTLNSSPILDDGNRHHTCLVWDRSVDDPGTLEYYVDGVSQGTFQLSGAVGSSLDPSGDSFKIGERVGGLEPDMQVYNVRIWTPASIPANIAAIVAEMASKPDEFPQLMKGVA